MAQILEIKKSIDSITKTRKITKAMQMVAASKMKNFQKKAVDVRDYALDLVYLLNQNESDLENSTFLEKREKGDTLFILYSSDKGLCGSLNQQLFKTLINSKVWKETKPEERKLITVGKKAKSFAAYNKHNTDLIVEGLDENLSLYASLGYVNDILKFWMNKSAKNIYIVAPHYKNSFTFYPLVKQLLPITDDILKAHIGIHPEIFSKDLDVKKSGYSIFEPSEEEVADKLIHQLIQILLLQSFTELKASEYSSRMMAMQNATSAADNIIDEKTLVYNKARQQIITQELAEIIAASDF